MLSTLERSDLKNFQSNALTSSPVALERPSSSLGVMPELLEADIPLNSLHRASDGLGSIPEPNNTLGTAYNIGVLSGTRSFTDFVGSSDTNDYYRFSLNGTSNFTLNLSGLSADADVEVIRDGNGNLIRDAYEVIGSSSYGGTSPESIILRGLAADTYYVRVNPYGSPIPSTNYSLSLTATLGLGVAPEPNNTLAQAHILNPSTGLIPAYLNGTRQFSGWVGSTDINDYYRFSLGTPSNINLALTGMGADADLLVIHDANNNLIVDPGEVIASSSWGGTHDEAINLADRPVGNYFVQVYRYSGDTNYRLSLSTLKPSNLLPVETDIGALGAPQTFTGSVGNANTADIYRFSLGAVSNVNLSLTGMTSDADLRLIRDANNNGIIDPSEVIASSTWSGSHDDAINLAGQPVGPYFVQVYQYSGNTNYRLSLSTVNPTSYLPSNLLPTETNIGGLSGTKVFSDWVGNTDTADVYRFSLAANSNFNLTLAGLSADADVRLIRDFNNNGMVDPNVVLPPYPNGDVLRVSRLGGNASEWISTFLSAGTYFVQVYQHSGNTNYYLSVSTGDWYSRNLHDPGIIGLARHFTTDGQLGRNDMMTILRDTKDGSVIDATELSDLRTLVMGKPDDPRPVAMPGYVYNLSYKIVSGNRANAWWTGGTTIHQSLGNLFAGSSADHMERLIGKWFLGLDHPTAVSWNSSTVYGYRSVSGSLFRGGANYSDIDQGELADCYLLAMLAGTAFRSPSQIGSMFIDNGDNTWTVRFYNGGVADYVTVDRYLPTNSSGYAVFAGWGGGNNTNVNNELWVALAEKAYAQINESNWIGQSGTNEYHGIDFGSPLLALNQITARNTSGYLALNNFSAFLNAYNAGRIVSINTSGHAYTVVGYNSSTGQFAIYNPYGSTGYYTWSQIQSTFANWGYSTS